MRLRRQNRHIETNPSSSGQILEIETQPLVNEISNTAEFTAELDLNSSRK